MTSAPHQAIDSTRHEPRRVRQESSRDYVRRTYICGRWIAGDDKGGENAKGHPTSTLHGSRPAKAVEWRDPTRDPLHRLHVFTVYG